MSTKSILRLTAGIVLPVLFYVIVTNWTTSGEQWFESHVAASLPFDTGLATFWVAFAAWVSGMVITCLIFDSQAAMMRWVSGLLLATEEYAQVHGSLSPRARHRRVG